MIDICYRTGYMGNDLNGTGIFKDKKLFSLLFCLYYPYYESSNCFVAVNEGGGVIGYIIGTPDTKKQLRRFIIKMSPKIIFRLVFYTLWCYPESFRLTMHFLFSLKKEDISHGLNMEYPAHLHINVLGGYQGAGIGKKLLSAFEERMRSLHASGIHLDTTNYNKKAVPFYLKAGYQLICENKSEMWPGVAGFKHLTFAKKLLYGKE